MAGIVWLGQELLRGPAHGLVLVEVTTEPAGATVSLDDGTELGLSPVRTPVKADANGDVAIRARLAGYRRAGPMRQRAALDEKLVFHFDLETLPPGPATLFVETLPPGAAVRVNGERRGTSPLEVTELPSDQAHRLEVTLAGHRSITQTVQLDPEEPTRLRLRLEPESVAKKRPAPASAAGKTAPQAAESGTQAPRSRAVFSGPTGHILVSSVPEAQVYADGQWVGQSNTGRRLQIPANGCEVELRSVGGERARTLVRVREGQVRVLEYDFHNAGWRQQDYRPF